MVRTEHPNTKLQNIVSDLDQARPQASPLEKPLPILPHSHDFKENY